MAGDLGAGLRATGVGPGGRAGGPGRARGGRSRRPPDAAAALLTGGPRRGRAGRRASPGGSDVVAACSRSSAATCASCCGRRSPVGSPSPPASSTAAYVASSPSPCTRSVPTSAPTLVVPLALVVLVGVGDPAQRRRLGSARGRHRGGVRPRRALVGRRAHRQRRVRGALGGGHGAGSARPARRCRRTPPSGPRRRAAALGGGPSWLSAPTRCSAAACRSTATSTEPPRAGCCSPTTRTSTGSTRSGPASTRSWSGPRPCATTTRVSRCVTPRRRRARVDRGLPEHPIKVTVTQRGRLDTSHRFFADDGSDKLVYACSARRRRPDPTARAGSARSSTQGTRYGWPT